MEFFEHENQACPCTIIVTHELVPSQTWFLHREFSPSTRVQVSGAAIVNMLRPGAARKFSDYANQVFIPYILSQLQHVNRVDVVWDYHKTETCSKRGKGVRQHVEPWYAIPEIWQEFLCIDDNKTELFSYLAICVSALDAGKQVISTHQADILCSQLRGTSGLAPCTHEEADSRMHATALEDAVKEGYTKAQLIHSTCSNSSNTTPRHL